MKKINFVMARKKILTGALIILLIILILSTLFGKKGLLQIREARRLQRELQAEIIRLKKEKERLEKEVEQLRLDPSTVEEEARRKLWLIKPEEKVLILPKSKQSKEK